MKQKLGKSFFMVPALLFLVGAGVSLYIYHTTYKGVIIRCPLKEPVTVASEKESLTVLPFMLVLDSLDVALHPLRLLAVNPVTGKVSREKPGFLDVDSTLTTGMLAGMRVQIHEFLPAARQIVSTDTVTYISYPYVGGVPAVRITVKNDVPSIETTGWVSHKNFMNPAQNLPVCDNKVIILPRARISGMWAKVIIYSTDKEPVSLCLSTNHAGREGRWKLSLIRHKEWEDLIGSCAEFKLKDLLWLWLSYAFAGLFLMTIAGEGIKRASKKRV